MWHTVEFSRFGRAPHHSLSGLVWGNRSNLLPGTFPVNSPCRRVSRSEGVPSYIFWRAIANQIPCDGGWLPVEFAGPFQSLRVVSVWATRKTLRAGYAPSQIAGISGVSHVSCLVNPKLTRRPAGPYEASRTIPIVFFPRRSDDPAARESVRRSRARRQHRHVDVVDVRATLLHGPASCAILTRRYPPQPARRQRGPGGTAPPGQLLGHPGERGRVQARQVATPEDRLGRHEASCGGRAMHQ